MSTAVLLFPPKLKRAKPHHHIGNKSPLKENPDLTGGGTGTHMPQSNKAHL